MRASDAVLHALAKQGRTQRSFAQALGITPQALDNRLNAKSMRVDTLCEMARELGCKVMIEGDGERFEIEG